MTMSQLAIARDPGIVINTPVIEKPVRARLGAYLIEGIGTLITGSMITKRGRQERAGTHDEKAGPPTDQ